jgi:hypothetical protein
VIRGLGFHGHARETRASAEGDGLRHGTGLCRAFDDEQGIIQRAFDARWRKRSERVKAERTSVRREE